MTDSARIVRAVTTASGSTRFSTHSSNTQGRNMKTSRTTWVGALAGSIALIAGLSACGGDDTTSDTSVAAGDTSTATDAPSSETPEAVTEGQLVGTFAIDAAVCSDPASVTGSYFRMVQGGGTVADGPFVANADSTCADQGYSALAPGTASLVTGAFQPQPENPFDEAGNGLADAIIAPVKFFGVDFALSSNEVDPASGATVTAPSIVLNADGTLSGDLNALSVAWNGQQFNQGSPKPDGSRPGLTTDLTGTYDAATGRFVIEWVSQIVGGPFDGFSGIWHLEGVFTAG